jgi:hypothetical protein
MAEVGEELRESGWGRGRTISHSPPPHTSNCKAKQFKKKKKEKEGQNFLELQLHPTVKPVSPTASHTVAQPTTIPRQKSQGQLSPQLLRDGPSLTPPFFA